MTPVLLNAARTFAMVSFADGNLAPAEQQRFAKVVGHEALLNHHGHAEIADAWAQASREVHATPSFGTALVTIRTEVTAEAEKALMMRIAQAAVVADGKLEAQENVAVRALAEALGLEADKY
jgi:tellurite resistance protein